MNEFLEQFLIESRELIAQATGDLLALEHAPQDNSRFDSAFRAIHTLKGAAGIMDFEAMAQVSHAMEDLLSAVRAGTQRMTPALVTHCLASLDQMSAWLAEMEESETLPAAASADAETVIARLSPAAAGTPEAAERPGGAGYAADAIAILHEQIELLALPGDAGSEGRKEAALAVIGNILQSSPRPSAPVPNAAERPNDMAAPVRTPRADTARADALMRLAGEFVVLKNALRHAVTAVQGDLPQQAGRELFRLDFQLGRLTDDLLHAAVAARILPLRQVFQRFPRLVREMAAAVNKKIMLRTEGDATEADRLIVEALSEPLLHVLRNAVDHGIEPAEQREALAKPNPAVIRLAAARVGDEVVIEVADDGRGIDPAVIRAAAAARGIADSAALAGMTDAELQALIFAPGFSTAGQVSNLSGRGVGMDAVRAAIDGLGGRVALQSHPGIGTVIRFHLPFTVVLTRVLMVEAAGQIFGIPSDSIAATLEIGRSDVVCLGAAETILWRGRTLPLIPLAKMLQLADTAPAGESLPAVIVEHGSAQTALQVERLLGQTEVMLKPLDRLLAGMRSIAGTAVLGDGRVLIVLELQDLLG